MSMENPHLDQHNEDAKPVALSDEYMEIFRAATARASQDDRDGLEQRIGFKGTDDGMYL